jgi:hypothetical protein
MEKVWVAVYRDKYGDEVTTRVLDIIDKTAT